MAESVDTKNGVNLIDASHNIEPTGDIEVNDTDDDDDPDYNTNVFIYNAIQKTSFPEYQSDVESNDIWVRRWVLA